VSEPGVLVVAAVAAVDGGRSRHRIRIRFSPNHRKVSGHSHNHNQPTPNVAVGNNANGARQDPVKAGIPDHLSVMNDRARNSRYLPPPNPISDRTHAPRCVAHVVKMSRPIDQKWCAHCISGHVDPLARNRAHRIGS